MSATQDTPGVDYSFNVTTQNRPMYKATLAIAIVYGVAILIIILLANLPGGQILSGEFYPFTLTFVLGMIVVLIAMTLTLITSNKPTPPPKVDMVEAGYKCPDYYEIKTIDDNWINTNIDDNLKTTHKTKFKKACTLKAGYSNYFASNGMLYFGTKIADSTADKAFDVTDDAIILNTAIDSSKASEVLADAVLYKSISSHPVKPTNTKITCGWAFPDYFEFLEGSNVAGMKSNELRCNYAKMCGVTWSSLQCDALKP